MPILFMLSIYFLSYIPLWFSVVFIDFCSILRNDEYLFTEYIGIIMISIVTLICGIIVQNEMKDLSDAEQDIYTIKEVMEKKTITADFLLSYTLPLFAFDFTTWDGVILFSIFFVTIGYLCITHNYFCVNLVLEMKKYRFYECKLQNSDGLNVYATIISKDKLTAYVGADIKMKALNNEYRVMKEIIS